MSTQLATRLENYFEDETNGNLRSIVKYEQDSFEVQFLRDDVRELYSEEEFVDAIDESRFESLTTPIYGNLYADEHGELECFVKSFENVVEMNFALSDGVGVAVALDSEAMAESHGLIVNARNIVVEEREGSQ